MRRNSLFWTGNLRKCSGFEKKVLQVGQGERRCGHNGGWESCKLDKERERWGWFAWRVSVSLHQLGWVFRNESFFSLPP